MMLREENITLTAMTDQSKKTFHRANLLLLGCAMICLVCYDIFGGLWLKGTTSAWFVLLGFCNLIYGQRMGLKKNRFLILIQLGLIFGMCADVLLGMVFVLGILAFAAGHVCYLVAFYSLEKFNRKDLFLILPLAVVSVFVVTGTPYIQVEDPMLKKLLVGYAVIIACMLGKAGSNLMQRRSVHARLVFLASAMFWFSDLMLAVDMFGTSSRLTWILCSYVYWPAQNLLAYSMYHFVSELRAKEAT